MNVKQFVRASIAVAGLTVGLSAFGDDHEFKYYVVSYPAIGDCHAVAADLGTKFEALTGIQPLESRCVDINEKGFDLEITYASTLEIPLQSTAQEPDLTTSSGVYASRAACEAALPDVASYFKATTKLEPFLSYCYQEFGTREDPWVARVDGFGEAEMRPFVSTASLIDSLASTDIDMIREQVTGALGARGVDVRFVKIRPSSLSEFQISVVYYAKERFRLESVEQARVESLEQCHQQLALATKFLGSTASKPLALFCTSSVLSRVFHVNGLHQNAPEAKSISSAESFASYEACEAARAAIVDAYTVRSRNKVLGGLCSQEFWSYPGIEWRVFLYSVKR